MHTDSRGNTAHAITFGSDMDIEEFYDADERRRRSEEVELGTEWHDGAGNRYEVSWVADTGELYVMLEPVAPLAEDPFGDVFSSSVPVDAVSVALVGWIPGRQRLDQVMSGWEEAMPKPDSIPWLADRLRRQDVPKAPPAG